MKGQPTVCYSMGTINSLVDKITELMKNHPLIGDLLPGLEILRKDHVNKFAGRATSEQVKVWMKQVREMLYDIEDWIDLKQEAANLEESDKTQIDEFKDQIQEVLDRCKRFELLNQAPNSDAQLVYAGSSDIGRGLLLEEKSVLVGTSGPKSDLLNHLVGKEQQKLKVVSILGTGGCGKTTLAKEVYGEIKAQFDCHAFVSVGRTTSTRTILIEILRQVKAEEDAPQSIRRYLEEEDAPQSIRRYLEAYLEDYIHKKQSNENEVMTWLWEFLRTKRYLVCVDDIRCTWASKLVNCALPDNNLGSRILSSTHIKDIATSCSRRPSDVVYEMVHLGEDDSKSLFLNSLHVREEEWPDHFKKTSKKLFKVCGGVPLAIIITAGLLGRTSAELSVKSKMLEETILSEFVPASQATKMILDISFRDLPLPLKSCFLYLSFFSGRYHINKDRLIRRWVAEGLIPKSHGIETGESYFGELICRRLIQPAFDDNDDQPIGCTVHSVVADFVESMSTEENFVTPGAELKSGLFPCDRVRRVSLDCTDEDEGDILFSNTYSFLEQNSWVASANDEDSSSDEDEAISVQLSRVRSLAFSGDAGRIPDLSAFKHVRVLDLEDTKGLKNKQLESIGRLSLLRYLGLGRTDVTKLPRKIMALEQLTTLDLRRTRVRHLPGHGNRWADCKLVSLLADELIIEPTRMWWKLPYLEELSKVHIMDLYGCSSADGVVRLVKSLKRLRMLGVRFGDLLDQSETDRLAGAMSFLREVGSSNLQSLLLDDCSHRLLGLLVDSWGHEKPHYLQKFELRIRGRLRLVPQEIASLIALTHLHIHVVEVEAQGVRALGRLPNLVLLKLYSFTTSARLTVSSMDGYQCLKVFWYECKFDVGMGLQFDAGAMPQLRRLRLHFNVRETMSKYGDFDFGIQHLPCLVQVTVECEGTSTASEVEAAEAHIRGQVSQNPNNPVLELNRTGHFDLMVEITRILRS